MNTDNIRKLLDKFYNGETDDAEERILEDFFLKDNVPSGFETDRKVFISLASLKDEKDIALPEGMDKRLSEKIDMLERQEKSGRRKRYTLYRYISGVAAAVFVGVCIHWFMDADKDNGRMKDTFDSPQEAYEATENALQLFAEAFNKGDMQVEKAREATRNIKEKIDNIKNFRK